MTHGNRARIATGLALAAILYSGPALALDGGARNGYDGNNYCQFCDDNPYNDSGTYSLDNGQHDFELKEWQEPSHDKLREQDMEWNASQETKLDNQCSNRFLSFEQRIHDQYYYDLKLPLSYFYESSGGWRAKFRERIGGACPRLLGVRH